MLCRGAPDWGGGKRSKYIKLCRPSLAPLAARLQVRLMQERGYRVGNIDCTIIAQRPKMSPHKEAIRENLCKLLGAHPSVVNIKVGALGMLCAISCFGASDAC
jgi:2-C-methyl-D-erythritol 2,4-cyclodiphosphate synthase